MPGMPLESLVQLGGTQDVDPSVDVTCCTGDFIIVNNLTNSKALPFCVGQVMDVDDNSAIVQWWHPSMSKEANLKAGRKRNILDLFGEWSPADELAVGKWNPYRHQFWPLRRFCCGDSFWRRALYFLSKSWTKSWIWTSSI